MSIQHNILSGVINGGPFDKEAIVSDIVNKEESETLGRNKAILLPYFIFVYLPVDHFEGFFMVHSYSREDSITDIFRSYVTNIFSGENYNKPIPEIFAPKSFQQDYKDGAVIKNMAFSTTVVDNVLSNDPIQNQFNEYKVEITITPLSKRGGEKLSLTHVMKLVDKFTLSKYFNGNKDMEVKDFKEKKIVVENETTKEPKTFKLDLLDSDFAPKHFLKDYVHINETGTPDFEQLKQHCIELFNNTILKELRPDLNVTTI
jgi:hypothetical protein